MVYPPCSSSHSQSHAQFPTPKEGKKAAEDSAFVVASQRGIGDEELGPVRVRTCVCHAHGTRPAKRKKRTECDQFEKSWTPSHTHHASNRPKTRQQTRGPGCSSHPCQGLGDHVVEDDPVIVPAPCVADEVLHSLGSLLREQPQVHVAQRRVDRRGQCELCRA